MIKKYFTYEDNFKTIVGMITGMLIVTFNLLSGLVISVILIELIFNKIEVSPVIFFLISAIPTIFFAVMLLIGILRILRFILNGIEIENYSYIRLVLLLSVVLYLSLILSYSLFSFTNNMLKELKFTL